MTLAARSAPYRITLIHPCIGRHVGMRRYIRTWLMQPIPMAVIASLIPDDVDKRFYDDRLEAIPYDEPTDMVAISVETYTAARAYQIASEYRQRGVPVIMGGFHATLCPQEVAQYAESVVVGEAEQLLPAVIDDYRHGTPQKIYRAQERSNPALIKPDRSIFTGKRYLPIGLVEFARGCRFKCDFCAVQTFFDATQTHRPVDRVITEIQQVRRRGQMIFFIDDNITSDIAAAKELCRALIPLKIRWVSQSSINVAYDEEALALLKRSGCQGLLVGFESLGEEALSTMNKSFNLMKGGPAQAMDNFRRHGLRIYGTFIFGYDTDTPASFEKTARFAQEQGMFIAAFNHITPFPGTPLYERLKKQNRLLYETWWHDPDYRYNMIPFTPSQMSPEELANRCVAARRQFYGWRSIFSRMKHKVHHANAFMLANFLAINVMHQRDVSVRNGLPLGDMNWNGSLIKAQ